jgi:hypothetical protein
MNEDQSKKQITATMPIVDGFDGYTDEVVGSDDDGGRGAPFNVIQGTMLKFTNESIWEGRDSEEIPADLELIAVDTQRVLVKFVGQERVDTRVLAPNELVPDLNKLNEACPREEWGKDFNGDPRGPWVFQRLVYLLHFDTMTKYTWPTGTVGGAICVRELADKVKTRRKIQGDQVYAVVTLSDTLMNTKFGGRQRPDLIVKKWVRFGSGPQLLPAVSTAPEPPKTLPGMPVVADPTLKEERGNDEIPFRDGPVIGAVPKAAAPAAPQRPAPTQKPVTTKRGVQKIAGRRGR